jgi:chorismate mutase-like protein
MKTRNELRAEIDAIDSQLLDLLNRRARLAIEVARLKEQEGSPLLDRERERTVVSRACAANGGPLHRQSVARIFQTLIRESRLVQSRAVKQPTRQEATERRRPVTAGMRGRA